MKTTLILIFSFISITGYSATDISARQTWELLKDQNSNGWADEGDIIRNEIEVTVYCKETQSIDVINHLEAAELSLVPGSVQVENGNIVYGNATTDNIMEVQGIQVAQPWGIATISYEAQIMSLTELGKKNIENHAIIRHSLGDYETNKIKIPVLSQVAISSTDSPFVYGNLIRLIVLLFIGIGFGVLSKRISIPYLSFD